MDKTNAYILVIVGIVALVGVATLFVGGNSVYSSSGPDVVGMALGAATCSDTDGGKTDYTTKGKVSGGTWVSASQKRRMSFLNC